MKISLSKHERLQERLTVHAAGVLEILAAFHSTPQATHIARQLVRSATAAAANYGEARAAESRADFVHKLRIVLKELNETSVWLQLIVKRFLGFLGKHLPNSR